MPTTGAPLAWGAFRLHRKPADSAHPAGGREWFLERNVGLRGCRDRGEISVQLRVGCEFVYECPQPTPMLLMLNVHPSRVSDLVVPDELATDPPIPISSYRDEFGNRCNCIVAPTGQLRRSANGIVTDRASPM